MHFVLHSELVYLSSLSPILVSAMFLTCPNICLVVCQRIMIFCLFAPQNCYEYISWNPVLFCTRGHETGCENMCRCGTLLHLLTMWCYGNMLGSLSCGPTGLLMKPQAVCACVCVLLQVNQNPGHLHNEFSASSHFFCQSGEMLIK